MGQLLLIDDNKQHLELYGELLRSEGHEVITAKNGETGLAKMTTENPDAVIVDVVMPEIDGVQFLGRAVKEHCNVPVILHTGYPEYVKQSVLNDMADAVVVKKSADPKRLLEQVHEALKDKVS